MNAVRSEKLWTVPPCCRPFPWWMTMPGLWDPVVLLCMVMVLPCMVVVLSGLVVVLPGLVVLLAVQRLGWAAPG